MYVANMSLLAPVGCYTHIESIRMYLRVFSPSLTRITSHQIKLN